MSRWLPFSRAAASLTLGGEAPFGLAGHARGTQLDVTVADALTRGWVCVPPTGLHDLGELRAVAEARFEAVFHASAAEWQIEADWSAEHAFVCSALPRAWLAALQAEAKEHDLKLRSIAPQWVRSLNRLPLAELSREPLAVACAFNTDGFAALFLQAGVPLDWRQHWCSRDEVVQRLRSQALMAGCELPAQAWAVGNVTESPGMRWHKAAA